MTWKDRPLTPRRRWTIHLKVAWSWFEYHFYIESHHLIQNSNSTKDKSSGRVKAVRILRFTMSTRHTDGGWAATVRRVQGVTGLNDQAATALLHRWQDNKELAINSYFDMPEAPAAPKRQKPAMLINSYFDMPEAPAAPKRQKPAMLPVPRGSMSTPTKRNHSEAIAGFAKMFARPVPTSASSTRALPPTKLPTSSTRGTRASFEEFAEHNVSATSSTRGEEVGEERRSAGISAAELTQEQLTQERLTQERLEMESAAQEGLNPLIKAAVCVPSPPPSPRTSLTLTSHGPLALLILTPILTLTITLASHLSPLTSHLSPLTSHLLPFVLKWVQLTFNYPYLYPPEPFPPLHPFGTPPLAPLCAPFRLWGPSPCAPEALPSTCHARSPAMWAMPRSSHKWPTSPLRCSGSTPQAPHPSGPSPCAPLAPLWRPSGALAVHRARSKLPSGVEDARAPVTAPSVTVAPPRTRVSCLL